MIILFFQCFLDLRLSTTIHAMVVDGQMDIPAASDCTMWTTVDLTAQDTRRNLRNGFQNSLLSTLRSRLYSRKRIPASQGRSRM